MANTRQLRRRIKSVKNTAQITKAMQMVAGVKMRKAQNQALNGRPYSESISSALIKLLPKVDLSAHPLLYGNDSKITGVIILSTDKSLCGALNTNLFRLILASYSSGAKLTPGSHLDSRPPRRTLEGGKVVFYTVGKKGRNFVTRVGGNLQADFENLDTVTFRQAKQLSNLLIDSFKAGEIGAVYLVYPQFVSALRQEPRSVKLLPIDIQSLGEGGGDGDEVGGEFLFEPNPDILLDSLLVHFVEEQIYQALLETKASEHSARMIAMQNATDNALELVADLNLTYNQTRQDSITKELLEITTAQLAME